MPYHPPLFPVIEAVFFALFGVKLLTARVAVAASVGVCAILLYRLSHATLGNRVLAACVTVTTLSLWTSQLVARDVMLEYPTMVFTLAALYCLRDIDRSYTMRRAVLFAIFAAAAVWTKQHSAFLGGVPILYALLARRWRLFIEKPFWVSTGLFAAAVLGFIALTRHFHGVGVDRMATHSSDAYWILVRTLPSYFRWIVEDLQGLPSVFAASAILSFVLTRRRDLRPPLKLGLYFAWIIALIVILVDLNATTERYLFFLFPATLSIGYAWLFRGCSCVLGERRAEFVAAGFGVAWFAVGLFVPVEFLRGPAAAAQLVVQGSPVRVLYAGEADGNFIFAARTLDPKLQVTVIPAAKLPPETWKPEALDGFCRQFGVDWIVFENSPVQQHPWTSLRDARPASLMLERSVPLDSNRSRWRMGTMDIYRFSGPAAHPGGVLKLPIRKIGGSIGVKL
jgi:4-amino-4-deoxy-L-arabinose transferase-like glycosyltransferase